MARKGFVLAAALLVVLMIAVLVAGVFLATMEEGNIARTSEAREQALIWAESALADAITTWPDRKAQAIGVAGEQLSTISDARMPGSLIVTRLDSTLYSIAAEARSSSSHSQAIRRIGVTVSVKNLVDDQTAVAPIVERWWLEFL
jgi:Tfp pilus assembly protein PilX